MFHKIRVEINQTLVFFFHSEVKADSVSKVQAFASIFRSLPTFLNMKYVREVQKLLEKHLTQSCWRYKGRVLHFSISSNLIKYVCFMMMMMIYIYIYIKRIHWYRVSYQEDKQ